MATDEKYPLALPQGTILAGQYIIEKVLGQGGFGITYKATDHKTGQKVAIKEYFPDSMATRTKTLVTAFSGERAESFAYGKGCFLQEAETLAEFIGNENIVRVHSYFEENETAYFVMEFVEGISFDNYIKEHGGRISYEEAEKILLPVIDALAAVHSRGIIHRDVTPDNIYITKDKTVKLLDFGAARYSLGDKSRSLDVVLKHGFAPKEQYTRRGRQGPYTDVYTLGASFYFAVTGRRPPDSIDRMDDDDLILPGNLGVAIPKSKEEAILKALNVQPSERFQSMEEFKKALLAADEPEARVSQVQQEIEKKETSPVQQKIFTAPEAAYPVQGQYQTSAPLQPVSQQAQPQEQSEPKRFIHGKKKWILPVGIGVGTVAVIALISAIALSGNKTKTEDNKPAHYDMMEETKADKRNSVSNTQKNQQNTEPEPVTETESKRVHTPVTGDGILGNTPDNLSQRGQMVVADNAVALAYPGGGMACSYENGDTYILEDSGVTCSISSVGDTLYYVNSGKAYSANWDGTGRQLIPELEKYSKIVTLYVTEKYFYIYLYGMDETMHDKDGNEIDNTFGLFCFRRGDGDFMGTVSCYELEYTFLDEMLYYIPLDGDGDEIYRLPADDFTAQPEQVVVLKDERCCFELVSEGDYIYALCGKNEFTNDLNRFFQYNVKNGNYKWYKFSGEKWPGTIHSCNVNEQYLYFVGDNWDSNGNYLGDRICRFYAEPEADTFSIETIYEGTEGQNYENLSVIKDYQKIIFSSWGNCNELGIARMDGSGDPFIIDDRNISNSK